MPVTEGKKSPQQPQPAEGSIKAADSAQAGETVVVKEPSGVQLSESTTSESKKSNEEIAKEVLASRWGRGRARNERLKEAGYDPSEIQEEVDKIINRS